MKQNNNEHYETLLAFLKKHNIKNGDFCNYWTHLDTVEYRQTIQICKKINPSKKQTQCYLNGMLYIENEQKIIIKPIQKDPYWIPCPLHFRFLDNVIIKENEDNHEIELEFKYSNSKEYVSIIKNK